MTPWHILPPPDIPADLLAWAGHPLLARLLVQRGLTTVAQAQAFVDPHAGQPAPPTHLPGMAAAVARLSQAIAHREQILVWGDFDVDGQTSTALLVSTLQTLGASPRYYIPNRLTEGHGIKLPALHQQLEPGVNLLLTCDTGIAEHAAVEAALAAGADVIITDHHDLPDVLPPALAALNPKVLPEQHPMRDLPGVGVAFQLALALLEAHGQAAAANALLDLVALGIVADVARQTADTRLWLQRGLAVLNDSHRLGLQAILEQTRLKPGRLTEEHIGFWLAPRLNALGRLGDANLGVELLTTTNLTRARILALQLEALNDRRKLLTDRVVVQALGQLEDSPHLAEADALVLAAQEWHPGVLGLAAGRLAGQYHRPAILLALRPAGLAHGSARSVADCDIHQALKTQAHLLATFGGHPMAAGLSLPPQNIAAFRQGLSAALAGCRPHTAPPLQVDALVDLPHLTPNLLAVIRRLAPFGPGNPPVQLACRNVRLAEEAIFGKTGRHKRLVVQNQAGQRQEVIWWGGAAEPSPQGIFDLAFTLGPDEFRGPEAVQVTWLAAHTQESPPKVTPVEFIDWRQFENPSAQISASSFTPALRAGASVIHPSSFILWAEGVTVPGFTPAARHQLQPAATLVIWQAPPGHDLFQQGLAAVKPRQVVLVGESGPFDTLPAFARQLTGLIKYALTRRAGEIDLPALAAAMAHRVSTVELGLNWLAALGKLTLTAESDELVVVQAARHPPSAEAAALETMLHTALAETAAYRRFFRQAGLNTLRQTA